MYVYNTLTKQKEELIPVKPGKISMYACGPTVYNYFHIGNARCFVVFDMLRRYLRYRGYDVTFVQNFTDVDDKMIRKANEEGVTVKAGQTIGYVGESAMVEIAEEPHLHFEMTVNGIAVDPLAYFEEEAVATLAKDESFESSTEE